MLVLVNLRRHLHVQLSPDGLMWKGLHGVNCTILGKHLAIHVRHLFGKGLHELDMGGRDLGLDGLRRRKVSGGGTNGCSNALGDCQLFGRGLPTVVGEASFDLCGDHQELGVGSLDMVVGGLHQG